MNATTNGMSPEAIAEQIDELRSSVHRAVVGQDEILNQVLICLLAAGHVLIEGVPGLGKTLIVRSIAEAIGGQFSRVQFTPDLMPSDISGHVMFDTKTDTFRIRKGPVFCNFLLADEINRAPAKTQSALLEVMQEHQVTIEGKSYEVAQPFLVLATQNPIEQEGTYPLPQAQLDRFLLKVHMNYPREAEEHDMVTRIAAGAVGDRLDVSAVKQVFEPQQILALQQAVANVAVDEQIGHYAVRIVRATRDWNGIDHGAGPRGSLALLRCARVVALMAARDFVTPDDIKQVVQPVLRHRIRLTADLEIEGYRPDDVLADLITNVEAPRQ